MILPFVFLLAVLLPVCLPIEFVDGVANVSVPYPSDPYLSWADSSFPSAASPDDLQTTQTSEIDLSSEPFGSDGPNAYNSGESQPDFEGKHSAENELDFEGKDPFVSEVPIWDQQHSYQQVPVPAISECVNSLTISCDIAQSENVIERFWAGIKSILWILATGGLRRRSEFSFKLRRRSRIDVVAEILRVSVEGARKTRIIQSANLNSRIVEGYLFELEHSRLLQRQTPGHTMFVTTSKGHLFLLSYLRMNRLLTQEVEILDADRNILRRERNQSFRKTRLSGAGRPELDDYSRPVEKGVRIDS